MGFKARVKKVFVRACPDTPPSWWPKDKKGNPFWVYVKGTDGSSWSIIADPVRDYACRPCDVNEITEFFADDHGPETDEEGNVDPGLGTFKFKTEVVR